MKLLKAYIALMYVMVPVIGIIFTLVSCTLDPVTGKPKAENTCIEKQYEILSIRVDDDAEYHITAKDANSGKVISFSDLKDYELSVTSVSMATKPILFYTEYQNSECHTSYRIWLPPGYNLTYFED